MYRPLRGGLFVYELVRLGMLVEAVGLAAPTGEEVVFPALVFGAANALFVLMALFVWRDPLRYGVYAPLYTAGKAISVIAALGWCVVSWQRIVNTIFINDSDILVVLGLLMCIAAGDILSACGGAALIRKFKRAEPALPPPANAPDETGTGKPDAL
jgi:hypothetical protein